MPKLGYARIIVRSEVRDLLEKIAEAQGYRSINRLLEAWIRVHPTTINEVFKEKSDVEKQALKWASFKKGSAETCFCIGGPGRT